MTLTEGMSAEPDTISVINKSEIRLYDIATLIAPLNDSINGKTAFVTRLPILGTREYELFFLGDDYVPPKVIRFRKDDPNSDVDDIVVSIENRNSYDTIVETLNLQKDTILAGYLRENPTVRHPLRVIRLADSDIYVSRLDDPTEVVFRIPLEEGISPASPYAFLRPAILEDDGDDRRRDSILSEDETKRQEEKDEFIRRMSSVPGVKVIFTDMPRVIERHETIRPGGSRDVERIAGQVVSAIASLDTRGFLDHAADGSKIRDILVKDTIGMGYDGRIPMYTDDQPILIRGKTDDEIQLPLWVMPVSSLERKGERGEDNAFSIPDFDVIGKGAYQFIKRIPDMNSDNRKQPYASYYKSVAEPLRIPTILTDPADMGENNYKITSPTLVIFPNQKLVEKDADEIKSKKDMSTVTDEITRDLIRVLLPEIRNNDEKDGIILKEATIITAKTAITSPNKGYVSHDAPIYFKLRSENPWKVSNKTKYDNASIVSSYNPIVLATTPTLLPDGIIRDTKTTLSFLSTFNKWSLLGRLDACGFLHNFYRRRTQ